MMKKTALSAQNIIERKQMKEKLRKHRKYLEDLAKKRPAGLIKINEQLQQEIIERRQAEQESERLNIELAQKNKELEQIVYVTSHDLRSPLVNIQGFGKEAGMAIGEVSSAFKSNGISEETRAKIILLLNEDIPEALNYIRTSAAKMDSLLSGLLKLSRLGRTKLKKKRLNINVMVYEVFRNFEFRFKEAHAKVEICELPPCRGDEMQINQVFSNLLDNALKYLGHEHPGLIRISGDKEEGQSVYCVEDNGIGIAPEHQEEIFKIFHQLEPGLNNGEGLGLTIVRKAVDRHNGRIWVESGPGKGSKFFISLPSA